MRVTAASYLLSRCLAVVCSTQTAAVKDCHRVRTRAGVCTRMGDKWMTDNVAITHKPSTTRRIGVDKAKCCAYVGYAWSVLYNEYSTALCSTLILLNHITAVDVRDENDDTKNVKYVRSRKQNDI